MPPLVDDPYAASASANTSSTDAPYIILLFLIASESIGASVLRAVVIPALEFKRSGLEFGCIFNNY